MTTVGSTGVHAQARAINDRLRVSLANVRDSRYVDDVKRAKIARAYLSAATDMATLQETYQATTKARRQYLQRHLFGIGSATDATAAAVSLRDATQRVDEIDPLKRGALRATIDGALLRGDDYLAKACFARAWSTGDNDVVNAYLEVYPRQSVLAEELLDLGDDDSGPDVVTAGASFFDGAAFMVHRPSEIAFTPDSKLHELANSEDAHA